MESVEGTVRAYFDTLNRSDLDGIAAMFAEDGAFLPNEAPTATGREQIGRSYAGTFQAVSFERELHIDQIREGPEVAVVLTHTTGTITFVAANNTIAADGRELFVLRRTGTGWQITHYMFNRPAGS